MAFVQVTTPAPAAVEAEAKPTPQVMGPAAATKVTAGAAETKGTTPRAWVIFGSLVAILAALAGSGFLNAESKPSALVIPAGIGLFAMFYAVTQGLERLLEPFSAFFYGSKAHTANRDAALAAAVDVQTATAPELRNRLTNLQAVAKNAQPTWNLMKNQTAEFAAKQEEKIAKVLQAIPGDWKGQDLKGAAGGRNGDPRIPTEKKKLPEFRMECLTALARQDPRAAADKVAADFVAAMQAELNQRRADKAIVYWALASVLGILLSGTLGLYLLHVVGLQGDGLNQGGVWTAAVWSWASLRHVLDLLVTGLAIGGGTKPLHDLIGNLQEAKNNRKDPSDVSEV